MLAAAAWLLAGLGGPLPAGAAAPPERLADAERFREEFGLRSDDAFVRGSFADADRYTSDAWGVPLTAAEEAELARRSLVREKMEPALTTFATYSDFAGVYFDQRRGGLVVFMSTDVEAWRSSDVAAAVEGVDHDVRPARWSYSELDALRAAVEADRPQWDAAGFRMIILGIDERENKVEIGLETVTDVARKAFAAEYGDAVYLSEQQVGEFDACTAMAFCWPLKGGLRMYWVGHSGTICTTGFMGRRTDTNALVVITAGHCLDETTGSAAWGHQANPAEAANFGTELGDTFFENASADVGLVQLNANAVAALGTGAKNTLHYQDPSYNDSVVSVTSHSNQLVGDPVCRMGWGTWDATQQGKTCGTITRRDYTDISKNSNATFNIRHQWQVSFDSLLGDSGGPIWRTIFASPPYITAYGTHVHSEEGAGANNGWYSPIGSSIFAYDNLPLSYTFRVCVTAAC
jgi:hypothetical protein